jgi:hypothetical protein
MGLGTRDGEKKMRHSSRVKRKSWAVDGKAAVPRWPGGRKRQRGTSEEGWEKEKEEKEQKI